MEWIVYYVMGRTVGGGESALTLSCRVLFLLWCLISDLIYSGSGLECGYPGSPAYGRPSPVRENYHPGHSVGFSCALGYTLQGNFQRICQENGSWTGQTPICDRSLAGMEQHATSRATLAMYAAENAIDGNRDTCTYTDKRKPRWIRVDLRKPYVVQAVSITVPKTMYKTDDAHFTIHVISVRGSTTATYHKCADFNGKFTTPTVKLSCPGGGLLGSYVHLEDNRNNVDYFSACEVEIFVRRDSYECGEVERPAHSYTTMPEAGVIEYKCMHGYRLEGNIRRRCLSNGQWDGIQPLCKEVLCPPLSVIPNGSVHYTGPSRGRAVEGTIANISCDYGFESNGTTLKCLKSGRWSDGELVCKPIDCLPPKVRNSVERVVLLNDSTTYGSMALFSCRNKEVVDAREEDKVIRTCREDGTWSPAVIDCTNKSGVSTLGLMEEDNLVPNGIIIGMAVVVFFLLVILILILLFKRKQLMRKNSAESIPSKETTSSYGNSPASSKDSKEGLPYDNDAFYANVSVDDQKHEDRHTESQQQQQRSVEKGILSTILFAKRKQDKVRTAKSKNDSASTSGEGCFYEEVSPAQKVKRRESPLTEGTTSQPVYAQVDYKEKRRSRLEKSLNEQLDCLDDESPTNGSTSEHLAYEAELDSEPIKLRELPPIPDDDHSSGTYASLSQPPEPPPSACILKDNMLYVTRQDSPCHQPFAPSTVITMKDNDLYTCQKNTIM